MRTAVRGLAASVACARVTAAADGRRKVGGGAAGESGALQQQEAEWTAVLVVAVVRWLCLSACLCACGRKTNSGGAAADSEGAAARKSRSPQRSQRQRPRGAACLAGAIGVVIVACAVDARVRHRSAGRLAALPLRSDPRRTRMAGRTEADADAHFSFRCARHSLVSPQPADCTADSRARVQMPLDGSRSELHYTAHCTRARIGTAHGDGCCALTGGVAAAAAGRMQAVTGSQSTPRQCSWPSQAQTAHGCHGLCTRGAEEQADPSRTRRAQTRRTAALLQPQVADRRGSSF